MATGYTTFADDSLEDASGVKVASATMYAQPVSWPGGRPIAFQGGDGHLTTSRTLSATVTAGAFTMQLADVRMANPPYIGYHLWCIDEGSGETILDLPCVQPFGATWGLDDYVPGTLPVATGTPVSGSGGGGSGTANLIFAAPNGTLWRIARVSGGLEALPYTGGLTPGAPLYLTDTDDSGNVYQLGVQNDSQITWTLVTGHAGVASFPIVDDATSAAATLTITSNDLIW